MKISPNISAKAFSTSAFLVAIILSDDMTPAEQNALGGWFMLVGQTLSTNAAQQQLLNNRNKSSTDYNSKIVNDNIKNSTENIKKEVNNIFNNFK